MFNLTKLLLLALLLTVSAGCSTKAKFIVPEGAQLYLANRAKPETIRADGTVKTKAFKWSSIGLPPKGGIPYRLEQDGKTIAQGKLRATFRGASLFWPPVVGVFVVPVGLNPHLVYDLTKEVNKAATVAQPDSTSSETVAPAPSN